MVCVFEKKKAVVKRLSKNQLLLKDRYIPPLETDLGLAGLKFSRALSVLFEMSCKTSFEDHSYKQ